MTLDELPAGRSATIQRLEASGRAGQRLFEMGLIPGSRVRMVGAAPLGDPLEIELEDYRLSLRRTEARQVELGEVDGAAP